MQRCWWLISFIALLFISHNNLYSQIDNWLDYSLDCDVYNNEPETSYGDEIYDSRNGCIYSPHGVIRFLVVFVELEYDNPNDDPFLDGTEYWGVGELPVWANSLFAAYDTTDFINKQVTKYYRLASSNDHIVLGDYLLAPDNGGVFKIHTADGNIKYHPEYITPIINQKLGNNIITASGTLSSFSDFDKWTPGSDGDVTKTKRFVIVK